MAEIELRNVSKLYADGTHAVKDMSLEIADGEFMILVGPSGCGKTTALRMLAGLERISAGEVRVAGEVVNELPPRERDVAMVFQNYALYPHMSVRHNMGFALKLAKVDKAEINRRVEEVATAPRSRRPAGPQARQALRRPAPARGDGTGDHPRPESLPDGRAALEPGREAPGRRCDRRSRSSRRD